MAGCSEDLWVCFHASVCSGFKQPSSAVFLSVPEQSGLESVSVRRWTEREISFMTKNVLHFTAGYILYNCVCDEYKSWVLNLEVYSLTFDLFIKNCQISWYYAWYSKFRWFHHTALQVTFWHHWRDFCLASRLPLICFFIFIYITLVNSIETFDSDVLQPYHVSVNR